MDDLVLAPARGLNFGVVFVPSVANAFLALFNHALFLRQQLLRVQVVLFDLFANAFLFSFLLLNLQQQLVQLLLQSTVLRIALVHDRLLLGNLLFQTFVFLLLDELGELLGLFDSLGSLSEVLGVWVQLRVEFILSHAAAVHLLQITY